MVQVHETINVQAVRILPWGEEIYLEIPLHRNSSNRFYARHGRTEDGREYLEFSKFGPVPNTDGETYSQKLRLFSAFQWAQLKYYVEGELANSAGWDIPAAQKEFKTRLKTEAEKKETA